MSRLFKIITLALVDIITSCSVPAAKVGETDELYLDEASEAFNALSTDIELDKINSYVEAIFNKIENPSSRPEDDRDFVLNFDRFSSKLMELIDAIHITRTKYYATDDQERRADYMDAYDTYLSCIQKYHDILEACYGSAYQKVIFGSMSNSEIRKVIDSYETNEEDKQFELLTEEYSGDAETIYQNYYSSNDYEDKMYEVLVKFVSACKNYATTKEIDYLDYVYESTYDRSYTPTSIVSFYDAVKEKLVPTIKEFKTYVEDIKTKAFTKQAASKYYEAFNSYNFKNSTVHALEAVETYVNQIYPLKRAYNNLWSSRGIYCFSNLDKSLGTAYTAYLPNEGEPLLYFSKDYQDVFTFIHEFGHYTSDYNSRGGNFSTDIAEIDSQANELLFASYLLDNKKLLPTTKDCVELIANSAVFSQLSSIVSCCFVSEMEQVILSYDISNKEGFLNKVDEVWHSYGDVPNKKYWWAPALTNFGYYISYATSNIGALQFFINSRDDYESAITKYSDFLEKDPSVTDIDKVIAKAKLLSTYAPSTVEYVANYFNSYMSEH